MWFRQDGFTLLEVMVCLALLGTIVLSVMGNYTVGMAISQRVIPKGEAVFFAQELLEKALGMDRDELPSQVVGENFLGIIETEEVEGVDLYLLQVSIFCRKEKDEEPLVSFFTYQSFRGEGWES